MRGIPTVNVIKLQQMQPYNIDLQGLSKISTLIIILFRMIINKALPILDFCVCEARGVEGDPVLPPRNIGCFVPLKRSGSFMIK